MVVLDGRSLPIYGPYAGPDSMYTSRRDACGIGGDAADAQVVSKYQTCHLPPSPIIFGNCITHQTMHQNVDNDNILSMSSG